MRLLDQHPEWRAELRRVLLTDELLSLPQVMRELAQDVRALAEAQARTEERIGRLEDRMDRVQAALAHLAEAQARTEERVGRLADVVGHLRGGDLERRYRERAHAYFDDLLADIHVAPPQELAAVVNRALAAGALSRQERKDVLDAGIVVRGHRWEDQADAYLAVEVSAVVGEGDVERAIRRAGLLNRATATPTVPVVAGQAITPEAEQLARSQGAWRVLDGRVFSPED
jgi:predicted nuclease with TOPRIM domain